MNRQEVTLVNLDEVEPWEAPWGRLFWLCNDAIDPRAELTFGMCEIEPGQNNPVHKHPNCEELLFVLEGECEHRLGEQALGLGPGALLRIPRGVWHCARNRGEGTLRMVIAFSSGDRRTILQEEEA
jgi:quercetin dioxygenase-like cupin family protein